ncbi:hypothetical protein P1P68_05885 [Streptomyces scabiei]|uniref:hypothetical protein n=1 Tax=Streptomyces scabiei TaxID=1930 RepID=UPI00298F7601|nr:hypothetical protein [Streptomyces scabiei]MDW8804332.1 hypothetical protein [Streptomyces scabiei]
MTEPTTLPLTGLEVPHTRYTITSLQQVTTRNGIAFSANVKKGRTLLGVIENTGDGGGTWFYPGTPNARQAMAEFTAACRWNGKPVGEEEVYERLIDEYDLARTAKRCARQRTSLLRGLDDDGGDNFLTVVAEVPSVWLASGDYPYMRQLAHDLARHEPAPATWQVWDGEQWKDLPLPEVAGNAA